MGRNVVEVDYATCWKRVFYIGFRRWLKRVFRCLQTGLIAVSEQSYFVITEILVVNLESQSGESVLSCRRYVNYFKTHTIFTTPSGPCHR